MKFLRPALTACLLPALAALEVVGQPPPDYLQEPVRPEWRATALSSIASEWQAALKRPVVTSPGIALAPAVILIERQRRPMREIFEQLERSHDLHITAEALRVVVTTGEEHRASRRRMVDLRLAEYGSALTLTSFAGVSLGYHASSNSRGFDLFGQDSGSEEAAGPSIEDLQDLLQVALGDTCTGRSLVLDGGNTVHTWVTPEEEQAMRGMLDQVLAEQVRRCAWQVSFGLLPAGQALPASGIVPAATAATLRHGLKDTHQLQLAGMLGQQVHAGHLDQHATVNDADVAGSGLLDPVIGVVITGRAGELKTLAGATSWRVSGSLSWCEPIARTSIPVQGLPQAGAEAAPDSIAISGTLAATEGDGAGKKQPKKDGEVELEGEVSMGTAVPPRGSQYMDLTAPTVWTWNPRLDLMLPHGHALVLTAPHPQGQAVIVLEEGTP